MERCLPSITTGKTTRPKPCKSMRRVLGQQSNWNLASQRRCHRAFTPRYSRGLGLLWGGIADPRRDFGVLLLRTAGGRAALPLQKKTKKKSALLRNRRRIPSVARAPQRIDVFCAMGLHDLLNEILNWRIRTMLKKIFSYFMLPL